jgi:TadE-like protein
VTDDRAQAIVEFALVLPLILLLIIAVILVGEVGVARLALEHGAAEAARTAALTNDDDLVRGTAAATVAPLEPSRVSVTIEPPRNEPPRSSSPRGSLVRVRLRYAIPVPLGFVGLPRFIVEGDAARRIEWTP